MAYSWLHPAEQEFLKTRLHEVFLKNTSQFLTLTQTPKSFEPLLNDIARIIQKLGMSVALKETDDGAQLIFESQEENLNYACSLRSLRDFFFNFDKLKNDTSFLNCTYLYITNGMYNRATFWEMNPEVYPLISELEIVNLMELVWDKYKNDVTINPLFEGFPTFLCSQMEDIGNPDACISKQSLIDFLKKPTNEYPDKVPITTLNSLYYYISDGKMNRNQYIDHTKDLSKENFSEISELNVDLPSDWRPFFAIYMVSAGIGLSLFFLCFTSIWWLPFLSFPFIFWGLGLFFALKSVMKNTMARGGVISKFWVWWFGASTVITNTLSGKVRIGIVFDDSYEVQQTIYTLRKTFNNVHLVEFKIDSKKEGISEADLNQYKLDGLYVLFTRNTYSKGYEAIRLFSLQNHDIPIVYKKFSGLEDKPIEFGNSVNYSNGEGLWHLLSQAVKRTGRWRQNAQIFRDYSNTALKLLSVCLAGCVLIIFVQKYICYNLQQKITRNEENIVSLTGLFLQSEKERLIEQNALGNPKDFNLSIWTLDRSTNRAEQLSRSDLGTDKYNKPVYFNLDGPGITPCAYNILDHDTDIKAVYSFKDSLGNFVSYKLYKNDIANTTSCQFCIDKSDGRNKFLQGFICIMDPKSRKLTTLEIQNDTTFSQIFLMNKEGREKLYNALNESLRNTLDSIDFSDFPKPKIEYNCKD